MHYCSPPCSFCLSETSKIDRSLVRGCGQYTTRPEISELEKLELDDHLASAPKDVFSTIMEFVGACACQTLGTHWLQNNRDTDKPPEFLQRCAHCDGDICASCDRGTCVCEQTKCCYDCVQNKLPLLCSCSTLDDMDALPDNSDTWHYFCHVCKNLPEFTHICKCNGVWCMYCTSKECKHCQKLFCCMCEISECAQCYEAHFYCGDCAGSACPGCDDFICADFERDEDRPWCTCISCGNCYCSKIDCMRKLAWCACKGERRCESCVNPNEQGKRWCCGSKECYKLIRGACQCGFIRCRKNVCECGRRVCVSKLVRCDCGVVTCGFCEYTNSSKEKCKCLLQKNYFACLTDI